MFILATNDHSDTLTMAELLATYKAQQNVERAFVFSRARVFNLLTVPEKAGRIEALLMVMTCSLMIYAALGAPIRQGLVEQESQCGGYEKETDPAADSPVGSFALWWHP